MKTPQHLENPYAKYINALKFFNQQLMKELHSGDVSYLNYRRVR